MSRWEWRTSEWKRENSEAATPGGRVRRRCVTRGEMLYRRRESNSSGEKTPDSSAPAELASRRREDRIDLVEANGLVDRLLDKVKDKLGRA